MVRVGIAGGSGYSGIELTRILLQHSEGESTWISSRRYAGKKVAELYPKLYGCSDIYFSPLEPIPAADLDVLFLALPHGHAMKIVPDLSDDLLIIDLSGDYRISNPQIFEEFYHLPAFDSEDQQKFVYGLPDINRKKISNARRIANPGCFATATLLALHPLTQEKWIKGPVFVDTKTGSSGAGRTASETTHHPRRMNSLFAYKPFQHQHLPEINEALQHPDYPLIFQTYSAPFVRGIFASHYTELIKPVTFEAVCELYANYYKDDFFIRWTPSCPDVNFVRHSNFVDIGAAIKGNYLIVWSVLDNLQKGAAGQAVQNMNLACGFSEEQALEALPAHP